MSIDYKQLESMVKEALAGDGVGGVMAPSAPEGVPHRMPAADTETPEHERGDKDANKMYEIALEAREATEQLVEALDEPIYDGAYEYAFKASACLRKALNALEQAGAHPMPGQRVVAPPKSQQPYGTGGSGAMNAYSMGYADFGALGAGLEEGMHTEMSANVKSAVEVVAKLSDEEKRQFTAYMLGLAQED